MYSGDLVVGGLCVHDSLYRAVREIYRFHQEAASTLENHTAEKTQYVWPTCPSS